MFGETSETEHECKFRYITFPRSRFYIRSIKRKKKIYNRVGLAFFENKSSWNSSLNTRIWIYVNKALLGPGYHSFKILEWIRIKASLFAQKILLQIDRGIERGSSKIEERFRPDGKFPEFQFPPIILLIDRSLDSYARSRINIGEKRIARGDRKGEK